MTETECLANILDSQLTILNIEGICSEHEVFEYEEYESEIVKCEHCKGTGLVDAEYLGDFLCDEDDDLFPLDLEYCSHCDGEGYFDKETLVKYQDSWTTSNIII